MTAKPGKRGSARSTAAWSASGTTRSVITAENLYMAENWSRWMEEYMKLALSILYQGLSGLSIVASAKSLL